MIYLLIIGLLIAIYLIYRFSAHIIVILVALGSYFFDKRYRDSIRKKHEGGQK